jgi:hypothetical protein
MRGLLNRILVFTLATLLAACANSAKESSPNDVSEILQTFQLVIPESQGPVPAAVLLHIPERGALTVCSAGRVNDSLVSNAHCLSDARKGSSTVGPGNFFVIFGDKNNGAKRIGRITKFVYEGREDYDDVLIAEVDKNTLDHWASFNSLAKVNDDDSHAGMLWAFDPVPSESRVLGSIQAMGITKFGAVFSKKQVQFTRQVPKVGSPADFENFAPNGKRLSSEIHLFLDSITPTTIKGNSGALLTSVSGDVLGTFHWQREKRSFAENDSYYGSSRQWKRIWSAELDIPQNWALVGVATQLSHFNFDF